MNEILFFLVDLCDAGRVEVKHSRADFETFTVQIQLGLPEVLS